MPADLARLGKLAEAQLRVRLVAAAFLALAGLVDDVMREPAIARSSVEFWNSR